MAIAVVRQQRFSLSHCLSYVSSHTFSRVRRIVACVLWLGACGGGDRAAIPIDELAEHAEAALCTYEVRCGWAPDTAACKEALYVRQQLVAEVKAGKVIYDGQAAAACLALYQTISCKVSEGGISILNMAQSCRDAVGGTVATGGACLIDEDCQSDACDRSACSATECCTGVCVAKVLAGGDCSAAGSRCADDLFCRRGTTGTAAICAELIADGQPCTRFDSCLPGRQCNLVTGTCGAPPATGQECPDMICDSMADFCDPASKTCLRRIAVGGDCSATPAGCGGFANCDAATKTCVARRRGGEACAQPNDCLTGVACTGGICVPPADQPACM